VVEDDSTLLPDVTAPEEAEKKDGFTQLVQSEPWSTGDPSYTSRWHPAPLQYILKYHVVYRQSILTYWGCKLPI